MKKIIFICMSLAMLGTACSKHADKYFTINENNMLKFADGTILLYQNTSGSVDTMIVDVLKYHDTKEFDDNSSKKSVKTTAYLDVLICRFRNIHDAAITQPLSPSCIQRSEKSFIYRRYFNQDADGFKEAAELSYGLNDATILDDNLMQNHVETGYAVYNNVYRISTDALLVYFTNQSGVIMFGTSDGYRCHLITE